MSPFHDLRRSRRPWQIDPKGVVRDAQGQSIFEARQQTPDIRTWAALIRKKFRATGACAPRRCCVGSPPAPIVDQKGNAVT